MTDLGDDFSDVSCYRGPERDVSYPDSDVPDELRFIPATHSDRDSVAGFLSFQDHQEEEEHSTKLPSPAVESPAQFCRFSPCLPYPYSTLHSSMTNRRD